MNTNDIHLREEFLPARSAESFTRATLIARLSLSRCNAVRMMIESTTGGCLMDKKKSKTKSKTSSKKPIGNITALLSEYWEQAKLPTDELDQQNFAAAAQVIVDFMDWHRIEEEEIKFVREKFFPTFLRVAKLQPSKEVSSHLLVKMGPDILDSLL
jgi:hypothetical protein